MGEKMQCQESGSVYSIAGDLKSGKIKNVITMVGAGISTAAGIPDFRSPGSGIYSQLSNYKLPYAEALFERRFFDKNPEPLFAVLRHMMTGSEYEPTKSHYFVKLLEKKGALLRHYTQNVDGLEGATGLSSEKIVEAHGTLRSSTCSRCKKKYDFPWLVAALRNSNADVPKCEQCGSLVRPNIVLFGDPLPAKFGECVQKDIPKCDLLIIMGTSLQVEPFASMAKQVRSSCPRLVINNVRCGEHLGIKYETNKSLKKNNPSVRDGFLQGDCETCVEYFTSLLGWDDEFNEVQRAKND